MIINGTEIKPGETKQINLNIARLPTRTSIEIPIYVYRSKKEGPCLLLLAGMHGDELNGVAIVRNLIASGKLMPAKGTVIAIPLFNIFGFLNLSRQVPGGKDVNRSFPGSPKGSLASRLAHAFMKEVFPHATIGVDYHTGGGNIDNHPQVRCLFTDEKSLELAKAFAPRFIVNSSLLDRSLRKEAAKRKVPLIVYEAGESMRTEETPVALGVKGTFRLMKHLGMASKAGRPRRATILLPKSAWVRARYAGMFTARAKNGAFVKRYALLGSIRDPYGEFEWPVRAPANGYIYGINYKAVVNQGDALIHIGVEK